MRALVYRAMRADSASAVGKPVSHCSVLSITNSWSMAKAGSEEAPKTAAAAAPRKALREASACKTVLLDCEEQADGAKAEAVAKVERTAMMESFILNLNLRLSTWKARSASVS